MGGQADEEYKVQVTYATGGTLVEDLGHAKSHAGHLQETLRESANMAQEMGSHLVHSFQHAVEHAAHLAAHLAKIGLAVGIGAAAYGVGHLNQELEQTQISLGALANRYEGVTFAKGFDMAGEQVNKMRQDIKALPGDLGQLSAMMKAIAPSAEAAGAGLDDIRKLAGKSMLVGTGVMGLDPELAARGISQLLQGRAGQHNIFGMMLGFQGDAAKKLHAASPGERFKMINAELAKYDAAAERMGKSFQAQFTTLKDNIKYVMVAGATAPLFERAKKTLGDINEWFDKYGPRLAQEVGDKLADAWDKGLAIIHEWGPVAVQFARQVSHELSMVWERFGPAIKEASDALKNALGNGTVLKDAEKLLSLYAVSKVSSADSGIGRGIGSVAGGAAGAAFGMPTAGAAVGGAVGAFGGIGTLGGLQGIAMEKMLQIGLVGALKDRPKETAAALGRLAAATQRLMDIFDTEFSPFLENFAIANINMAAKALEGFATVIDTVEHPMQKVRDALDTFGDALGIAGFGLRGLIKFLEDHHIISKVLNKEDPIGSPERSQVLTGFARAMGNTVLAQNAEHLKKGAGPGAGGTHVQKVEIVVNTNQDANRVAEMVVDKIHHLNRHPKLTQHAPNYSR